MMALGCFIRPPPSGAGWPMTSKQATALPSSNMSNYGPVIGVATGSHVITSFSHRESSSCPPCPPCPTLATLLATLPTLPTLECHNHRLQGSPKAKGHPRSHLPSLGQHDPPLAHSQPITGVPASCPGVPRTRARASGCSASGIMALADALDPFHYP